MSYKALFATFSVLVLSACGSVGHGPTQDVTLKTPGAQNAQCTLHNEDFKYVMETDETRQIMRSDEDLIVDCLAPANRTKTVIVPRELTGYGQANILNLGVGSLYDYYDNSLYGYPDVLVVDFTDIPPRSYGTPKAHAYDLPHPDTAPVTSYAPSVPVTEFDRINPQPPLFKKDMGVE